MRWTFSTAFALLALGAILAPLLAAEGRLEASLLYSAFRPFCHQQVDRLWTLDGEPLAACVRCLGVYWGIALGVFAPAPFGFRKAIAFAATACLANWALEAAGILVPPEAVRFAAGLAFGVTAGCAVAVGLRRGEPRAGLLQ